MNNVILIYPKLILSPLELWGALGLVFVSVGGGGEGCRRVCILHWGWLVGGRFQANWSRGFPRS